jgi:hypothetical protein
MAGDEILAVNDVEVGDVEKNPLQDLKGALQGTKIIISRLFQDIILEVVLREICEEHLSLRKLDFSSNSLADSCIKLELRSPRDEPPVASKVTSDAIISSLVIKPPPKLR